MRQFLALCCLSVALIGCSRDPAAVKREYVQSGDEYMRQGKYREAAIEYANAVRTDSQYGEARFKLGEAYYASGNTRGAFPEFIRAADLLKDDVEAQLRAGHLLLSGGLFQEARTRARIVLEKDPRNPIALVLLGNTLAGLKSLDDAVSVIERAISVDPERAGIHANLAVFQMARGDEAAAEVAFKKAVEVTNGAPGARLALGNFYRAVKRWPEAETVLKSAWEQDRRSVPVNRALAGLYVESARIREAESYFAAIATIQQDAPSRLALAAYYALAGRDAEAVKTLESLAVEPAHFGEAKVQLAMLYFARGRRSEAHRTIDEVLARESTNPAAITMKSRLLLADNRPGEALVRIKEGVSIRPDVADAQLTLGRVHLVLRNIEDARRAFNEALRLDQQSLAARLELSDLHLKRGEIESAIDFADQAVSRHRTNLAARIALVRALAASTDHRERADGESRSLLASYPRVAAVYAVIGSLQAGRGDRLSARRSFELALELDPDSTDALTGLTAIDIEENRGLQAQRRVEALVASHPHATAPLLLAANVYGLTGNAVKAEAALKQAMTLEPSNPSIYSLLGGLYILQQRVPEAIHEFEQVARLEPKSTGAATMLGLLYYMQKNRLEAETWWEKAVQIDARAAAAANNLAWIYAENGENLDEALQLAQTAKARYPDAAEVNDTLGWIYYRKGLTGFAINYLEQSIEKDPDNALYRYHLGKAYALQGEDRRARQALERALSLDPAFEHAADARKTIAKLVF